MIKIKEDNIKISFIIPFNYVKDTDFIKDSLNSILNQTLDNFEIICINNSSEDLSSNFSTSDKNIKIMLDFFKMQEFQVIFCAPPNKMDSIGKECDVIIPIQKINKSNMTLGEIIFHE